MKVLFIAEVASVHSAKWIQAATENGVEAAVFYPTYAPTGISHAFQFFKGAFYTPTNLKAPEGTKQFPLSNSDDFYAEYSPNNLYPEKYSDYLLSVIRQMRPDLIHVLGICVNMNNQTRCLNAARKKSVHPLPPVIYSSWGTDLDYFFPHYPEEQKSVKYFLKKTSYYISECQRDLRLSCKIGFHGKFKGFLPANGGFDTETFTHPKENQERPLILIKGRDQTDGDPIGRAMTILESLALCADTVRPFKIQILQAHKAENIPRKALEISNQHNLSIEVLPYVEDKELYAKLAQSYLYISMTINDGLPISLVESMALGVFPIFSDLESLRDYIEHEKNGYLTPSDQPQILANFITKAIQNPDFVRRARQFNYNLVDEKLSKKSVAPKIKKIYQEMERRFNLWKIVKKYG